jgi:hypothetical protein
MTMVMTGIAFLTLAALMQYAISDAKMADRSNQYNRAVSAAEATTEKVLTQMSQDYLNGGNTLVSANLSTYRLITPTASDSSYWADWQFSDASGNAGQTYVQLASATNYVVATTAYAGLQGFAWTYSIVSNARETAAYQNVTASVLEQVALAQIPIFQFAMYTSGDMEISCGQPFSVTGPVHSNGQLYVEPDNALTFESAVTAVGNIQFSRDPLDTRAAPAGSVVYMVPDVSGAPPLTLPIGTSNSPLAIRAIIDPPPLGESPSSSLGQERYYNQADMVIIVSATGVSATSGLFNGFLTPVPTNQLNLFITTTNSFVDSREDKTVLPIDINMAAFDNWSGTNGSLRPALGSRDVSSIYVVDKRTLSANQLGAVRLSQGLNLPSRGLTVATADPMYVWGDYNQTNHSNLGTTNTTTTMPASLVADAITILSDSWVDHNSTIAVNNRVATATTVNAAILAGAVETTEGHYGGGMENFPRFLESWTSIPFTYNGSMIKMFPSQYATNYWGQTNVYNPPVRNWAFDVNFSNPAKLPPLTPSLLQVIRSQWATVAPGQTSATPMF